MRRDWERVAPWLGVVFIALFVVSIVVVGVVPAGSTSGATVVSWYTAHRGGALASGYLMPLVVLLGLLFYGHLRDRLAKESRGLAAAAFGGAILAAVSGAVSAGVELALAESPKGLTAGTAQTLNMLGGSLGDAAASAGGAVLMVAAGVAILRGGILPRWTGWLGLVFGLVALLPGLEFVPLLAPVWTLIVSVVMIRRPAVADSRERAAGATLAGAAG